MFLQAVFLSASGFSSRCLSAFNFFLLKIAFWKLSFCRLTFYKLPFWKLSFCKLFSEQCLSISLFCCKLAFFKLSFVRLYSAFLEVMFCYVVFRMVIFHPFVPMHVEFFKLSILQMSHSSCLSTYCQAQAKPQLQLLLDWAEPYFQFLPSPTHTRKAISELAAS